MAMFHPILNFAPDKILSTLPDQNPVQEENLKTFLLNWNWRDGLELAGNTDNPAASNLPQSRIQGWQKGECAGRGMREFL